MLAFAKASMILSLRLGLGGDPKFYLHFCNVLRLSTRHACFNTWTRSYLSSLLLLLLLHTPICILRGYHCFECKHAAGEKRLQESHEISMSYSKMVPLISFLRLVSMWLCILQGNLALKCLDCLPDSPSKRSLQLMVDYVLERIF